MSYILDALSKSERQRNLGRIPTLTATYEAAPPRRRILPGLAGVAIGGVLAALGWLYRPTVEPLMQAKTEAPQTSPAAPAVPAAVMQRAVPAAQAPASPAPAVTAHAPQPAAPPSPPPAASLPPPRATPRSAPSIAAPAASAAPSRRSERQPHPPAAVEPPPPAPVAAAKIRPEPAPAVPMLASAVPASRAARAEPNASPAAAAPAQVPLLQQMPFDFQRAVPRVRIDALVYSEHPSGRMVFIGKQKYREGQQVEGKLKVEHITREGVVFGYRDQQFLLRP
jgi:hypothetical protein